MTDAKVLSSYRVKYPYLIIVETSAVDHSSQMIHKFSVSWIFFLSSSLCSSWLRRRCPHCLVRTGGHLRVLASDQTFSLYLTQTEKAPNDEWKHTKVITFRAEGQNVENAVRSNLDSLFTPILLITVCVPEFWI